jgi:hypothetical protein
MGDETPKQPSAYRKMMEFIMENWSYQKQRREFSEYYDYIEAANSPGIRVELQQAFLTEATRAQVGLFTARRDAPHFNGDEYHGHCEVGGGHEVAWTISGIRRHPSKFPTHIPYDAKAAIAKVLKVSPDILEVFWIEDDGKRILLLESR